MPVIKATFPLIELRFLVLLIHSDHLAIDILDKDRVTLKRKSVGGDEQDFGVSRETDVEKLLETATIIEIGVPPIKLPVFEFQLTDETRGRYIGELPFYDRAAHGNAGDVARPNNLTCLHIQALCVIPDVGWCDIRIEQEKARPLLEEIKGVYAAFVLNIELTFAIRGEDVAIRRHLVSQAVNVYQDSVGVRPLGISRLDGRSWLTVKVRGNDSRNIGLLLVGTAMARDKEECGSECYDKECKRLQTPHRRIICSFTLAATAGDVNAERRVRPKAKLAPGPTAVIKLPSTTTSSPV